MRRSPSAMTTCCRIWLRLYAEDQARPVPHFTKPPEVFEATCERMERRYWSPSNYAAIISTIQDRGYVALHNRRFYSEKMGDIVTERLSESFSNLMDYGFTAGMEENLDDVAQGERDWKNVLDEFYGDFKKKLEVAESPESGMRANQPVMTDIPCLTADGPMQIRTAPPACSRCSGYSLPPKERCRPPSTCAGDEIAADDEGESESLVLCVASTVARSAARRWTPTCWTRNTAAHLRQQPDATATRSKRAPTASRAMKVRAGMRQVWQRDAVKTAVSASFRVHQPDRKNTANC